MSARCPVRREPFVVGVNGNPSKRRRGDDAIPGDDANAADRGTGAGDPRALRPELSVRGDGEGTVVVNYLLMVCSDGVPTVEKAAAMRDEIPRWLGSLSERGADVYGHVLNPGPTAKTVRVRDGHTIVSDGPFAETKEFIGGFEIIDCLDAEEAVAIAADHPLAPYHCVEVREFADEG